MIEKREITITEGCCDNDRIDWGKGILVSQPELTIAHMNPIREWSPRTRTKKMQKARAKAKRARRAKR